MSEEGAEMFAASGTTARIIYAAVFHLLDNSASLQLLLEELDAAIPNAAAIPPVRNLENLTYLVSLAFK